VAGAGLRVEIRFLECLAADIRKRDGFSGST
jgi:hypothetical protein